MSQRHARCARVRERVHTWAPGSRPTGRSLTLTHCTLRRTLGACIHDDATTPTSAAAGLESLITAENAGNLGAMDAAKRNGACSRRRGTRRRAYKAKSCFQTREKPDSESMNEKAPRGHAVFAISQQSWDVIRYVIWFIRSIATDRVLPRFLHYESRFLPYGGKLSGSCNETVGGTRAIFRDAWVLAASNIHTWLRERSTPRWPCRSSASRYCGGNVWRFLSRMIVMRDRRCDTSRSLADPWQAGFLSLDQRSKVLRKARHPGSFWILH